MADPIDNARVLEVAAQFLENAKPEWHVTEDDALVIARAIDTVLGREEALAQTGTASDLINLAIVEEVWRRSEGGVDPSPEELASAVAVFKAGGQRGYGLSVPEKLEDEVVVQHNLDKPGAQL